MTLRTCTKVNIGLNVLRKRPDGYHDLETLFVPYWGFGDVLTVVPGEALSIDIQREGGVDWDPMTDLTVRAWQLLKADFPSLPEVSIRLEKGAPVGAGLGGGSADAAFMLRALNEIGGLGLDDAELAGYAARLGSDCAFFVYCRPMFGSGRGEILEPFDIDLSGYELRVEIPIDHETGKPVAVSTREAYGGIVPRDKRHTLATIPLHPQGTGGVPPDTPCVGPAVLQNSGGIVPREAERMPEWRIGREDPSHPRLIAGGAHERSEVGGIERAGERKVFWTSASRRATLRGALKLPVEQWRGVVVNDFEATVCPHHPEIPALIDDFYRRGAVYAAMSGSGSSVFGLFPRR